MLTILWLLVSCEWRAVCLSSEQTTKVKEALWKGPLKNMISVYGNTDQAVLENADSLLKKIPLEVNGTDSGLYNIDLFEGDILLKEPEKKSAVTNPEALWPEAVITFKIADDVGCPYSKRCYIIMAAMEEFHRKTCLRFKDWTGEEDFVEIFYNKQDSGACWSEVGRSKGRQRLSLGHRCWYLGIAIHELGHVLGFWHEMNRPDRDNHIIIHWGNILQGFTSAFVKNPPTTVNTLREAFDLKSIMMYDEYAFSKNGISPTIETKSKAVIGPLWKKTGLSQSDVRRIHKLYRCDGTNPKNGVPHNFKCKFTSHACGFHNRGKPIWKWKLIRKNEGFMFAFSNDTSSRGQLASINFHPSSSTNDSISLGCLSFTYFLTSSSLQVNVEKLSSLTDIGYSTTAKLWNSSNTRKWYSVQMNIDIAKPYRVIFEMYPRADNSSATIDNIEISMKKCELLRNEISSYQEYVISGNEF